MKKTNIAIAITAALVMAGPAYGQATLLGTGASSSATNSVSIGTNAFSAFYSTAIGAYSDASGEGTFAGGYGAEATGYRSTSLGFGAVTTGSQSISIGAMSSATDFYSIAFGTGAHAFGYNSMALGSTARVESTGTNSVSLGGYSSTSEADVISIGNSNYKRRITNVADGINANDAVNKSQLDTAIASVSGGSVDTVARTAAATAQTGVNNIVNGTTDIGGAKVGGQTLTTWLSQITGGGTDATARAAADAAQVSATGAGALATAAQSTADTALSAVNALTPRVDILEATVATQGGAIVAAQNTADSAFTHSQETRALFDDFSAKTEQRFNALDHRLDDMSKEYRAGIAASMAGTHAVMSAAQAGGIGVGLSTFGGEVAISVGMARQIGLLSLNASLSHSSGNTGAGVGFGWRLN